MDLSYYLVSFHFRLRTPTSISCWAGLLTTSSLSYTLLWLFPRVMLFFKEAVRRNASRCMFMSFVMLTFFSISSSLHLSLWIWDTVWCRFLTPVQLCSCHFLCAVSGKHYISTYVRPNHTVSHNCFLSQSREERWNVITSTGAVFFMWIWITVWGHFFHP